LSGKTRFCLVIPEKSDADSQHLSNFRPHGLTRFLVYAALTQPFSLKRFTTKIRDRLPGFALAGRERYDSPMDNHQAREGALIAYAVRGKGKGKSGECGITLDLGHRLLRVRNPRARKIVDEFTLAAACRKLVPVVLGAGCGTMIRFLDGAYKGPLAVVDREEKILAVSGARDASYPSLDITWLSAPSLTATLAALTSWRSESGGGQFYVMQHPAYMALDRDYYLALYKRLKMDNVARTMSGCE